MNDNIYHSLNIIALRTGQFQFCASAGIGSGVGNGVGSTVASGVGIIVGSGVADGLTIGSTIGVGVGLAITMISAELLAINSLPEEAIGSFQVPVPSGSRLNDFPSVLKV